MGRASIGMEAWLSWGVATSTALVSRTRCNVPALRRRAGTQKGQALCCYGPRLCSAPLRAAQRPGHETSLALPRRARNLRLLHWCHLRRRDETLQLGDAGAAIGAGLGLCADLGGGARAG